MTTEEKVKIQEELHELELMLEHLTENSVNLRNYLEGRIAGLKLLLEEG